jgi:primosomal protein N' (replication factor Y)
VQDNFSARPNNASSKPAQSSLPQYVDVALPLHVDQTFTYRLPDSVRDVARPGARIVVPFGRKLLTGYIVDLRNELKENSTLDESEVKEAEELLDVVPLIAPDVLQLTQWVSDYYAAPWGEVLKAALPPGITESIEQVFSLTPKGIEELATSNEAGATTNKSRLLTLIASKDKLSLRAAASALGHTQAINAARALERAGSLVITQGTRGAAAKEKVQKALRLVAGSELNQPAFTEPQRRVIDALEVAGGAASLREVLKNAQVSESAIKTLQKKGVVETYVEPVRRDPLANVILPPLETHTLTNAQVSVLSEIEAQVARSTYATFLLHGVTGSGKTEIYIRAMRTTLELGRSAMMLVPEIALTPVFSRRLRAEFGDRVAIFHSSLSTGERFDEWNRVKNGEARIVIGTRSAVFAPVTRLGLVIIDEEHEATYRQQDSPHYNARDTAIVRAQ